MVLIPETALQHESVAAMTSSVSQADDDVALPTPLEGLGWNG
jgi:hypothetical protein